MDVTNVVRTTVNFTAYQGDTFNPVFTFIDSDEDPLVFTSAVFTLHVRRTTDQLVRTMKSDGPSPEITVVSNVVSVAGILDIAAGEYVYDLQVLYVTGVLKTLVGGTLTVEDETTHAV